MKNYCIALFLMLLFVTGCGTVKYVPVESSENVKIEYRDSVKIVKDTIRIEVPQESQFQAVLDTLSTLETSVAISTAKVDYRGVLSHSLENKKVELEKEYVYLDRIVHRDSVVVQEVQVPYEVQVEKRYIPKWSWISLIINILIACYIGIKLYLKFRGV